MTATVIWFRELDKWSIPKSLRLASKLPNGWVWAKIEDLARQIGDRVRVEPDNKYQLIGVKWYGEGTFHRETVIGREISAIYLTPVRAGAFIYNRLFAWKTSFAVVPKEHDGYFVSGEFPQFLLDTSRVLPEFLYLIFRLDRTIKLVTATSSGSAAVSRNRFKENEFLKFELALPPLETQRTIISRWQEAQRAIAQAEEKVIELEKGIEKQFFADLGLKTAAYVQNLKVFTAHWKDFERWSVSYNQSILGSIDISKGKYPLTELGAILSLVQYGTSEKANEKENGVPVLRINNIKGGAFELSDLKHIPLQEKVKKNLLMKDGDILIIRTSGSRNLVGTCAVFHEQSEFVFASYLIRLRVSNDKANPDYVAWLINSRIGRQQVDAVSRQIMQNNINSQELRSLKLPLPPLYMQQEIMAHIEEGRTEIARQKELAEKIRKDSEAEIEALILGTKKI